VTWILKNRQDQSKSQDLKSAYKSTYRSPTNEVFTPTTEVELTLQKNYVKSRVLFFYGKKSLGELDFEGRQD
jgi:hypothetical protein